MNFTATADYIKWTIGFAAVGLAYVQSNFSGEGEFWGYTLLAWIPLAVQIIFLLSTIFGIFVVSAIVGNENDQARKETPGKPKSSRLDSVKFWGNAHLFSLAAGFALALIPFSDLAWHGKPPKAQCQIENAGMVLSFDCTAAPK